MKIQTSARPTSARRRAILAFLAGAVTLTAFGVTAWSKRPPTTFEDAPSGGKFDVAPSGAFLAGHGGAVRALAYSPDGKTLASGGEDGRVVLWDSDSHAKLRTLDVGELPIRGLTFGKDGKTVVVAHGTMLSLWKADPGEKLWETAPTDGVLGALGLAAAGDVVWVGDLAGGVAGVRLKDHKKIRGWRAYEAEVRSLSTSAKGGYVATSGDRSGAHVWAAPKGKRVTDLSKHDDSIVALSPDGRVVAVGGEIEADGETGPGVVVYEVPEGWERKVLTLGDAAGAGAHVAGIAWHKSGDLIAIAMTGSGSSYVMELSAAKFTYGTIGTSRACVAISRDGTRLATGTSLGTGLVSDYRIRER